MKSPPTKASASDSPNTVKTVRWPRPVRGRVAASSFTARKLSPGAGGATAIDELRQLILAQNELHRHVLPGVADLHPLGELGKSARAFAERITHFAQGV